MKAMTCLKNERKTEMGSSSSSSSSSGKGYRLGWVLPRSQGVSQVSEYL